MPQPQEICVFFPCHTLEDFPTHLRDDAAAGILAAWTAPWEPRILAASGKLPTWHRADTPPVDLQGRLLLVPTASLSRMPGDLDQRVGDALDCDQIRVTERAAATKEILAFLAVPGTVPQEYEDSADPTRDPDPAAASGTAELNSNGSPAPEAGEAGPDQRDSGNDPPAESPRPSESNGSDASPAASAANPSSDADSSIPKPEADDFFALGYAALQIQLMTRRLRYSSNLDLVTFEDHAVAAARHWCEGDRNEAGRRLQAAFDLLGEERDHYFSGDPHLIDLVLVAPSTLGEPLREALQSPAPLNLLMSGETAEMLADEHPELVEQIRSRWEAGTLAVVGGAPDDQSTLDAMSAAEVQPWLAEGVSTLRRIFGQPPRVFGRLGGGIPGDLPPWLRGEGMIGAITNDFASGIGSQNEAKMLWQSGGSEIEALTAKPLDAAQPHSYLALGPRLGEAVDSGQVAAALLVRWPGQRLELINDLRRASRFTPALGHFWTLDEFFQRGERPYHSCTLPAVVAAGTGLETAVEAGQSNPLSGVADRFVKRLRADAAGTMNTLAGLLQGRAVDDDSLHEGSTGQLDQAASRLTVALGHRPAPHPPQRESSNGSAAASVAVLNPHNGAARAQLELAGPPPESKTPGLFATSTRGKRSQVTIDVPGPGFATLAAGPSGTRPTSAGKPGWQSWFSRSKPLASGHQMSNEFLDVAIHPESGGIAAVHAGAQRGNRFSWQLAYFDRNGPDDGYSSMVCDRLKVESADRAAGRIAAEGRLQVAGETVGQFSIQYAIERGSRWIDVHVSLDLSSRLKDSAWANYVTGRAAWATGALSIRPLVRDKRHRTSGKRIEAPLGVIVDEGDRRLQVCTYGLPAHRRIGNQRLDTLLMVRGEQSRDFRLAYGFDVPAPLRAARQKIVPPSIVPLAEMNGQPSRNWLIDIDSPKVIAVHWQWDGAQRLLVTLVETSGQPTKTRLQLFRDIVAAETIASQESLTVEQGALIVSLAGHEVRPIAIQLN